MNPKKGTAVEPMGKPYTLNPTNELGNRLGIAPALRRKLIGPWTGPSWQQRGLGF